MSVTYYAQGNASAIVFLSELISDKNKHLVFPILVKMNQIPTLKGYALHVLYDHLCYRDIALVSRLCTQCPSYLLEDACLRTDYSGRELVKHYLNDNLLHKRIILRKEPSQ